MVSTRILKVSFNSYVDSCLSSKHDFYTDYFDRWFNKMTLKDYMNEWVIFFPCVDIMADAINTPNVVEATNKPGLFEKLEDIQVKFI